MEKTLTTIVNLLKKQEIKPESTRDLIVTEDEFIEKFEVIDLVSEESKIEANRNTKIFEILDNEGLFPHVCDEDMNDMGTYMIFYERIEDRPNSQLWLFGIIRKCQIELHLVNESNEIDPIHGIYTIGLKKPLTRTHIEILQSVFSIVYNCSENSMEYEINRCIKIIKTFK
jgi:hypothetical protein